MKKHAPIDQVEKNGPEDPSNIRCQLGDQKKTTDLIENVLLLLSSEDVVLRITKQRKEAANLWTNDELREM